MRSISSEQLAKEVERFLVDHPIVYIPTKGNSMIPFIKGESDMVAVRRPLGEYRKGMIVLARTLDQRVVLHRIISIGKEYLDLMGDGNLYGKERCRRSDVVAIAESVLAQDGEHIGLYTKKRMWEWRLWYWLCPFRKILLRLWDLR